MKESMVLNAKFFSELGLIMRKARTRYHLQATLIKKLHATTDQTTAIRKMYVKETIEFGKQIV